MTVKPHEEDRTPQVYDKFDQTFVDALETFNKFGQDITPVGQDFEDRGSNDYSGYVR